MIIALCIIAYFIAGGGIVALGSRLRFQFTKEVFEEPVFCGAMVIIWPTMLATFVLIGFGYLLYRSMDWVGRQCQHITRPKPSKEK